jgi:hypothetical protein
VSSTQGTTDMESKRPHVDLQDFLSRKRQFERERRAHRRKLLESRRARVRRRVQEFRRMQVLLEGRAASGEQTEQINARAPDQFSVQKNASPDKDGEQFADQSNRSSTERVPKRYAQAISKGQEARTKRQAELFEREQQRQRLSEERERRAQLRENQRTAHLRRTRKGQPYLNLQIEALLAKLKRG